MNTELYLKVDFLGTGVGLQKAYNRNGKRNIDFPSFSRSRIVNVIATGVINTQSSRVTKFVLGRALPVCDPAWRACDVPQTPYSAGIGTPSPLSTPQRIRYLVEHSYSRFESIHLFILSESIRIDSFCKKNRPFDSIVVLQFFLLIYCSLH